MQQVGGISAEIRPPWRQVAASALLAAVVAGGWAVWRADQVGAVSLAEAALPLALLLVAGAAGAAALEARSHARQRDLADALRDARSRWQCVGELLDVWQWHADASLRVVEMRPPRGASPADWKGAAKAAEFWDVFCAERDEAALRARLSIGAPIDDIEVRRAGDADRPSELLSARPILDALGAFAGYHGILRPGLSATSVSAAAPASTMDSTLADTASAEQESFSYTVSHDLRAPIRVVEGFTKIIKEDYGRLLDRVGNDHLDRVLGAAARMNNMIDALLALSRLASQPLARQPVNLSQLAGYVADDLRRQSPERNVTLVIEPGILLSGDPTLLRVVLENLLGNAWKYTAKTAQPRVSLERDPDSPDSFTVRDNGAGFDMRFADRLFGVFQRLHSANDFPGTGIGLATVRRIVRRHGGEIWGEAEVNRGAQFHFSLPQSTPQGATASPASRRLQPEAIPTSSASISRSA